MVKPITDEELMSNKTLRVAYCEYDFHRRFQYHYGRPNMASRQKTWCSDLQNWFHILLKWFRGSRKTSLLRWFVIWCAVYNKHPYIVRQSYEQNASSDNVRQIAKMMFKKSVVADHGLLFPLEVKREDLAKKSLHDFQTTNNVRIVARSLGENLRGANEYEMEWEESSRPTLLVMDDIDVNDSVQNPQIIEKNFKKITGETIEAMDHFHRQIVLLGNVILEDWVVPRFESMYNWEKWWKCHSQPLIDKDGNNTWPDVFTKEVVADIRSTTTKVSWKQNYLLEPDVMGNGVFIRDYFDYYLWSDFENVASSLRRHDMIVWLIVDPAFSTNSKSDDAVVMALGMHRISRQFYEIDGYAWTSAPSKTISELISMVRRVQWEWFNVEFISVELVTINKDQTEFVENLKRELTKWDINIPVKIYTPKVKKETRIKDGLEPLMSQKWFKIRRDLVTPWFNTKMETQFLQFPNADHDDIIDTVNQWVEVLREYTKKEEKREEKPAKPRYYYNPVTWKKTLIAP